MKQDVYDQLEEADWKSIGISLAAHAAYLIRNSRWRGGTDDNIVKGIGPVDIASETIERAISGDLNWDPDKGGLLAYLKAIVTNRVKDLFEKASKVRECDHRGEGSEQGLPISPIVQSPDDPEAIAIARQEEEQASELISAIMEEVADKPELMEVLEALMDGYGPQPRYIAECLGVEVNDINNRLKRLRRRGDAILEGRQE